MLFVISILFSVGFASLIISVISVLWAMGRIWEKTEIDDSPWQMSGAENQRSLSLEQNLEGKDFYRRAEMIAFRSQNTLANTPINDALVVSILDKINHPSLSSSSGNRRIKARNNFNRESPL